MIGRIAFSPGRNGLWIALSIIDCGKYPNGKRRQSKERRSVRTKKEGYEWHNARLHAAQNGSLETTTERLAREAAERVKVERANLAGLIDLWFAKHRTTLRGTTELRYSGLIERLRPFTEKESVVDFKRKGAKAMFEDLAARGGTSTKKGGRKGARTGGRPLGRSSVTQARNIVNSAIEKAVEDEVIPANVLVGMKLEMKGPDEREVPTVGDVQRLLAASAAEPYLHLRAGIVLGSACGLRRGEALALKWTNCNLTEGWLDVKESVEEYRNTLGLKPPKTIAGKRRIELDADTIAVLRAHRARQAEDALRCGPSYDRTFVCGNPNGGHLWRPSNFTTAYQRLTRALGIPATFHDLRHFHATSLIAAGVDPVTVSKRLGHTNVAFTLKRYCHAVTDSGRRAADTFAAYMRGQASGVSTEAAS